MYTKILVPLDGSERSERVLPPARSIVEALKVEVELLQVIDPNSEDWRLATSRHSGFPISWFGVWGPSWDLVRVPSPCWNS